MKISKTDCETHRSYYLEPIEIEDLVAEEVIDPFEQTIDDKVLPKIVGRLIDTLAQKDLLTAAEVFFIIKGFKAPETDLPERVSFNR